MLRLSIVAVLVLIGVVIAAVQGPGRQEEFAISVDPREVPADGYSEVVATIRSASLPQLTASSRAVRIGKLVQISEGSWRAAIRSTTMPGEVKLDATSNKLKTEATVVLQRYDADRQEDGMPDALELDSENDQQAFRRWFTFLAEAQFFQPAGLRPLEINDCAALIRYSYREALRSHDAGWARDAKLPLVRAIPSVEKYDYPHTLLGPTLFRVKGGAYDPSEPGAFSQFADAQSLQRFNTRLISRDVSRAQPGDLLFYRHNASDLPFHVMIFLGESQVENGGHERFVVYHTGPDGNYPGEIRRPTLDELLRHPNPVWRPLPGNPTFLGVFRWNILPK